MRETFGEFIKKRRLDLGFGLRDFCEVIRMDPSNYSKYERGVWEPPNEPLVKRIARGLKILQSDPAWSELKLLASAGRGQVPKESMRPEVISLLPAFFQKLRKTHIPDDVDPLEALVKLLTDQEA